LDALLGANHSNSGAIARICNAAERQNSQFQRREELFSVSLNVIPLFQQIAQEEGDIEYSKQPYVFFFPC